MTGVQFRRWYGFSLRMARRGFPGMSRRGARFVSCCVKDFFRQLRNDDNVDREKGSPSVIERIVNWDHTDNGRMPKDRYGHGFIGDYVCDMVSTFEEESWNPHRYGRENDYRRWDDRWGARIRCCIRAGLDCASAPSAGVIGFTVGDLRRMYRGAVPAWVAEGLVHAKTKKPIDLNSRKIRDREAVWL